MVRLRSLTRLYDPRYVAVFVAVPILILLFIAAMIMTGRHSSRKRAARPKGSEN